MKTRNSFVSNSSTSSFIIIAPVKPNVIDKVLSSFNDDEQELIRNLMGEGNIKTLDGKKYEIFFGEIASESVYEEAYEIVSKDDENGKDCEGKAEKVAEAWDKFFDKMAKQKSCVALSN